MRAGRALYEKMHGSHNARSVNEFDEKMGLGEWLMIQGDYAKCREVLLQCIELASSPEEQAQVYDSLGQAVQSLGDVEQAKQYFLEANEVDPDGSYERLLSLAQLHEGYDSLEYYHKGLDLALSNLELLTPKKKKGKAHKDPASKAERAELRYTISNIYCSIADLYLTDLCDEENAERECENALKQAVMMCPNNSEGYRLLASLKLIQKHKEQACQYALQAHKMVLKAMENQSSNIPEFSARADLAKLLLELNLCEEASELFEALIDEVPIYIELWYYAAVALINLASEKEEGRTENCYTAAHHLLRARKMLESDPDEELLASVNGQLESLAAIGVDLERAEAELTVELAEEAGQTIEEVKISDAEILAIAAENERELEELEAQKAQESEEEVYDSDDDEDGDEEDLMDDADGEEAEEEEDPERGVEMKDHM